MTSNSFKTSEILELIYTKKSDYWEQVRQETAVNLFHKAAENVPAYGKFLIENNVDYQKVKSWDDFKNIPIVDKKNYLRQYLFEELCWNGDLKKPIIYTSTSGSTGEPFYFVRKADELEWQYSVITQLFLNQSLENIKKATLVIDCLAMGVWIGGVLTYKAYEMSAIRNNLPISIITPGISKKDIFNALRNLAPKYDQVIIVGYPPFVKDIIDESSSNGIDLKKIDLKFHFAAEAITENFRDYLSKKSKIKNLYLDTLNIYGSADIGAMAFETITSILIKRLAMKNKQLFHDIFSPINKTPTLAQFIPNFINFEDVGGQIVLTGNSEMPLVRYRIGDNGGVLTFNEIKSTLKKYGVDIYEEAKKLGLDGSISELPFVYVYERADLSISFYGLNIYPEWLRDAFLDPKVSDYLTGKFTLITNFDKNQNQELNIYIEKKKEVDLSTSIQKTVNEKIISCLIANSSEYRELQNKLDKRANPKIEFIDNGDPNYFLSGAKQKWVKK